MQQFSLVYLSRISTKLSNSLLYPAQRQDHVMHTVTAGQLSSTITQKAFEEESIRLWP